MLPMNYFDRNGKKWSIENGDWLSHQSKSNYTQKNYLLKFKGRGLILIILVIAVVITFISIV